MLTPSKIYAVKTGHPRYLSVAKIGRKLEYTGLNASEAKRAERTGLNSRFKRLG